MASKKRPQHEPEKDEEVCDNCGEPFRTGHKCSEEEEEDKEESRTPTCPGCNGRDSLHGLGCPEALDGIQPHARHSEEDKKVAVVLTKADILRDFVIAQRQWFSSSSFRDSWEKSGRSIYETFAGRRDAMGGADEVTDDELVQLLGTFKRTLGPLTHTRLFDSVLEEAEDAAEDNDKELLQLDDLLRPTGSTVQDFIDELEGLPTGAGVVLRAVFAAAEGKPSDWCHLLAAVKGTARKLKL